MKQSGIKLKGFLVKDGKVIRNERVYAINVQLKRKAGGSKRVKYVRGKG